MHATQRVSVNPNSYPNNLPDALRA